MMISEHSVKTDLFFTKNSWTPEPYGFRLKVPEAIMQKAFDLSSVFQKYSNIGRVPSWVQEGAEAFFFDVDSTLIEQETIDEIAKKHGLYDQIARDTAQAMAGKKDFAQSVMERVSLLKGLDAAEIAQIVQDLTFSPGVLDLIEWCHRRGIPVFLVSGGFTLTVRFFAEKIRAKRFYASELEIGKDGKLTGRIEGPLLDGPRKVHFYLEACKEFALNPLRCAFVGDGSNDRNAMDRAGWAIGYDPKPVLYPHLDLKLGKGGFSFLRHFLESNL